MENKWLQKIRKIQDKTQDEIAAKADITRPYYAMIEAGVRTPSPKVAMRIAAALNFDWTRFYEDPEEEILQEA